MVSVIFALQQDVWSLARLVDARNRPTIAVVGIVRGVKYYRCYIGVTNWNRPSLPDYGKCARERLLRNASQCAA